MNAEVCWLYEVAVKPGQAGALRALLVELMESAQAEPGTLAYQWSVSDDDSVGHVYERYADSAATLAHLAMFRERFAERFLTAVVPARVVVYGTPSDRLREALSASDPVYMSALTGFAH